MVVIETSTTTSTTSTTNNNNNNGAVTLPGLFVALIRLVLSDSIETLFEKQALVEQISALVVQETSIALIVSEAEQARHGTPPSGSVLSYIVDALKPTTERELRLIALRQLQLMLERAPSSAARRSLALALQRCVVPARLVSQCLLDVESNEVADAASRVLVLVASDDDAAVAQTFFGTGDGQIDFDSDADADNAAARLVLAFDKLSDTMDVRAYEFLVELYNSQNGVAARRIDAHASLSALLRSLATKLTSNDILLKMNIVELIVKVSVLSFICARKKFEFRVDSLFVCLLSFLTRIFINSCVNRAKELSCVCA